MREAHDFSRIHNVIEAGFWGRDKRFLRNGFRGFAGAHVEILRFLASCKSSLPSHSPFQTVRPVNRVRYPPPFACLVYFAVQLSFPSAGIDFGTRKCQPPLNATLPPGRADLAKGCCS